MEKSKEQIMSGYKILPKVANFEELLDKVKSKTNLTDEQLADFIGLNGCDDLLRRVEEDPVAQKRLYDFFCWVWLVY